MTALSRYAMASVVLAGCAALAAGCDPGVKTTNASQATGDRLSKEYETCSSTSQCEEDLRCRSGECRSTKSSVKGDFYAAVGRRAMAAGDDDAAAAAYRKAEAEYRAEKLDVPPEILCGLGGALAANPNDPIRAEEAASKLHRCLRAVPVRVPLYDRALASLAGLYDVGLDPVHLAREDTADRYLTRAPEKPPVDDLEVVVTADKERSSKAFKQFVELLQSDEGKQAMIPCWKAYWDETHEAELSVQIPFKHLPNRYDEARDTEYATIVVGKYDPPSDKALSTATKCVEKAVEPMGKKLARKVGSWSRWAATFTIKLAS